MLERRYTKLKEFILKGKWKIDMDNGVVIGRNGGKGIPDEDGYLYTRVFDNHKEYRYMIHEIIAVAGGLNPTGATVDHINNDKTDNRLCNLQILSREANTSKANKGRTDILKGSSVATSKLNEQQVLQIKAILIEGSLTQQQIADYYGVSQTNISRIALGKTWKQLEVEVC